MKIFLENVFFINLYMVKNSTVFEVHNKGTNFIIEGDTM